MTYNNRINRRTVLAGITASGLAASCKPSSKKYDAEVIVLGAGLSGLYAAYLLASEGKDVLVLEGSDRVGGRMQTIYHNGHYTEGGGEQIGASYARIIDRATTLGIKLTESAGGARQTAYHYKGQTFSPGDWKKFGAHPLPEPFKGGSPGGALFRLAGQSNPFGYAGDWRSNDFANYDISAKAFLSAQGFDKAALVHVDQALNANSLESYSIMNVYRTLYLYNQSRNMGPSVYVPGGAQILMNAMAAELNVKKGQIVSNIHADDQGVSIETRAGKKFRAADCICSLPFGALRHVKAKAPLTNAHKEAINYLPYTQILQVHFEVEYPYWDKDNLPADMWTDLPMERLFANRNLEGELTGLARMWINGTGAAAINPKTDEKISEIAQSWISKVRPEAGKINVYKIQRWTKSNSLAGGAYMHWAPGQIKKWAEKMGQSAGRLHFCGEHLSHLHTGMEGAMESAENTAFRLLGV